MVLEARRIRGLLASRLAIPEEEQSEQLPSGTARFDNQVAWARFYLTRVGLLDSSRRGVWSLTEKGRGTTLTHAAALQIMKDLHKVFAAERKAWPQTDGVEEFLENSSPEAALATRGPSNHREGLLTILKSLPPGGFERLCQRLLRESGFQHVTVTGRSGDGGLDGNGVVEVNPFVSFRVLFQSKRYSGAVTPAQVRDFRGAMAGRADKGIIMTTGTSRPKPAVRQFGMAFPQSNWWTAKSLSTCSRSLSLGSNRRLPTRSTTASSRTSNREGAGEQGHRADGAEDAPRLMPRSLDGAKKRRPIRSFPCRAIWPKKVRPHVNDEGN